MSSQDGVHELPENLLVEILNDEGTSIDGSSARLVVNGNEQSDTANYEFEVWANPGERLTFVPRDIR